MAGCFDLLLKIDGVDRTSLLIHESLMIDQSNDGLNSTCVFDLLDQAVVRGDAWTVEHTHIETDGDVITGYLTFFPQTKVDICITNVAGTVIYFAGLLARLTATHMGAVEIRGHVTPESEVLRCECVDYNQVLEEMVIDDFREYGGLTDKQLIDDVFDEFVAPFDDPYDIDYATHVTAVPHAFDIITFDSVTVRQFMDTLCGITGAVWYVDYERKLHYAASEAAIIPAWHLSDVPDEVNSFAYFDDISKEKDATNLVNRVFVVGGPVSLWFIDADSIATYGSHRAIVRDTSLIDIDDIEAKGNAILEKLKHPVVIYRLKTYKGTPGGGATNVIRAGQFIRIVSAFYDLDEAFLINSLTITFPVDGTPVYEITCGGLDSSASGAAGRYDLDQIHVPNITPSSLPIASRGWGHDMTFSSTDYRTVAWEGPGGGDGTITAADGQEFDITPANTGNMGNVTYIYLDTSLSLTVLRHSVNPEDSIGLGKILIAVCAPGIPAAAPQPEVLAMYQVFGGGAGTTLFLHADNIAGNCITANEMYVNFLSAIVADMGVLTAGEIRMYSGTWDADADGFRIVVNEIAGQLNGVDQIIISGTDGKLTAGAGAVVLDEDGVTIEGEELADPLAFSDPNALKYVYDDSGTPRRIGEVIGCYRHDGGDIGVMAVRASRVAGDPWTDLCTVILIAKDDVAGTDVRLYVNSDGVVSVIGSTDFQTNAMITASGDIKTLTDARIGGGLIVGSTGIDPVAGRIYTDGANTDGTKGWELGARHAGTVSLTGHIDIWINGTHYQVNCKTV